MTILKKLLSVLVLALGISGAAYGQTTTFHDALARDWQGADQRRWLDDESGVQRNSITNVLPTKVNSFHRSYVESVSSVGGQLCVPMAISMALNASLASRWRRIIRPITCSARA
jgi:hypothetical protein